MINARDLFVEISNQPVLENGESVGYFVKNSRMDALEELLSANSPQPVPVVPEECPAELPYAQVKAAADLYALCWQSGEVVTYTPAPEKATIWLNNYSGTCVQEYVKLERLQEALAGNSPVIPDGWISCSERMPAQDDWVLIYSKYGEYLAGQVQGEYVELNDGTLSWLGAALHWMPLPEPPQEVNRG